MNFLQICQRVRQEADIVGTGPATVTGQTGELKRIVDWTATAYEAIQNRHEDWLWLRGQFTLDTVDGTRQYEYGDATDVDDAAAISRFRHWWWEDVEFPWRIYKQSDGVATERYLTPLEWGTFRRLYLLGSGQSGFPAHVTVDPQNRVVLGPTPDAVYVVSGDYQKGNQALAADADTPEMPSQFHMLIVWEALKLYGQHESASESMAKGEYNGLPILRALEANRQPMIQLAGPLA